MPQLQQPGAQHPPPGFVARIKALMNLPSTSGAIASTSMPASTRKCRASSIEYTRVGSIEILLNPACASLAAYSRSSSAPAMQPTHRSEEHTSELQSLRHL